MSTRRKVNNKKCLLLRFLSDNERIDIGFAAWLTKNDQKRIEVLMEEKKEVMVSWRTYIEIQPTEKLEKKFKNATFLEKSAVILAFGGKLLIYVKNRRFSSLL